MITNIYGPSGRKIVTCDNCEEGFEAESFRDALARMVEDGWKSTNKSGSWEHFCSDCREDE